MKPLIVALLIALPLLADEVSVARFACGPDNIKFSVRSIGPQPAAQPDAGKAMVYVVEDFGRPANEIRRPTIRVGLDGAWVGANRGSSYLSFSVEPGEHHLCTDWQSLPPWLSVRPSLAELRAEPSHSYYFRARVMEGAGFFTLDLEPMNSDEGKMLVATSPESEYQRKK